MSSGTMSGSYSPDEGLEVRNEGATAVLVGSYLSHSLASSHKTLSYFSLHLGWF